MGEPMKERMLIIKSLFVKKGTLIISVLLLIVVMTAGIISLSFLRSLNKYVECSKENNISLRTLSVSKRSMEDQTSELSKVDYEAISSIENVLTAYSYKNYMKSSTVQISAAGKEVNIRCNLIGMDDKSFPSELGNGKYTYESLSNNGVLIPNVLYDRDSKPIKTKGLIGNTVTVEIVQYDYANASGIAVKPQVIDTKYVEFTVQGIYDSESFPGMSNQLYISTENVGTLNDLYWQGYMDNTYNSIAMVIVDDFANMGKTTDDLAGKGYEAYPMGTIELGAIAVTRWISIVILIILSLVLCMGVFYLLRNNLIKNEDQLHILMATGYTNRQIHKFYIFYIMAAVLLCFAVSWIVSAIIRRPLSMFFFSDIYRLRVSIMTCLEVLACSCVVAVCSVISGLTDLFAAPVVFEEE